MKRFVLMTGCTGELGLRVLTQILQAPVLKYEKIFLLVRSSADQSGLERVQKLLQQYMGPLESRRALSVIKVCEGDVTRNQFGLEQSTFSDLQRKTTDIFHFAALTKFFAPIADLRRVNVIGTRNILNFISTSSRVEELHYISTAFVAGRHSGFFSEKDFSCNQSFNNPYEQSKFEAEQFVRFFKNRRIRLCIYRPSIVVGEYETGKINDFKMFYQPLKLLSKELFEVLPVDINTRLNLIPVDIAASMIRILSSIKGRGMEVYHITSPSDIEILRLISLASSFFGFKKPRFCKSDKKFLEKFTPVQLRGIESYLPYFNFKARFVSKQTQQVLKLQGFQFPSIDEKFLLRLFSFAAEKRIILYKLKKNC